MAMKIKMLKLISEYRGYAIVTNRRPAPRPPMLYLMQLREQAQKGPVVRRRLQIEVEPAALHTPHPVKINHVSTDASAMPVVIG